jgi:3-oxoacyl-[acyl-carrier protein] reductase
VACHALTGDISDPAFRDGLMQTAFTRLNDMRFLVNCAAISRPTKPLEITPEEWRSVYMVNTESTFFCCQSFIGHLLERERPGSIVNLSSIAGHSGGVNNGIHYGSSKAAIMAMTRGLARAFGKHDIRVNCVAPGVIDTAMARAVPGSDERVKSAPLGRWGTSAEVADTIAYLLGNTSSYLTGQTLDVNGGMT